MGYRRRGRRRFEERAGVGFWMDEVQGLYDGWELFSAKIGDLVDEPWYNPDENYSKFDDLLHDRGGFYALVKDTLQVMKDVSRSAGDLTIEWSRMTVEDMAREVKSNIAKIESVLKRGLDGMGLTWEEWDEFIDEKMLDLIEKIILVLGRDYYPA